MGLRAETSSVVSPLYNCAFFASGVPVGWAETPSSSSHSFVPRVPKKCLPLLSGTRPHSGSGER